MSAIFSFIALGSNIGNRKEYLSLAILLIEKQCIILKKSSIYETDPVGYVDQEKFLNMVVKIKTELVVEELFVFLQDIEKQLGKDIEFKDGPRTIDLDVLFYGDEVIEKKNIMIPHPRLHERLFVLKPLCEIAKDFVHPVLKKDMRTLLQECLNVA